ncbi:VOC family protein [Pontibacillus salicampi]|uniref:VOC family protein n=1 Tax=Pontibacillus salicampi TaxID=1449801 RepID=A0ABV6LM07_9BACI
MKLHHIGYEVRHLPQSIRYFTQNFGFQIEKELFFQGEEITFLKKQNTRIELIKHSSQLVNPNVHFCFEIENLQEELQRTGITPLEGPYWIEQEKWLTVFVEGPQKTILELLQQK